MDGNEVTKTNNNAKKTAVNMAFQTAYQILNSLLPLITTPYLARVFGADRLGIFSYTQSIVNYFVLAAMLGITTYGIRTIASVESSLTGRSKAFCSIYAFQFFTSVIAFLAYFAYWVFFCRSNRIIALIQAVEIFSCIINISWFFFGIEELKATVSCNFVIRILSAVSIFLFIKEKNDLWIYTLIIVSSTFLSHAYLWSKIKKYVSFTKVEINEILRHIKPILILFIPIAAMSVYHTMDKTMLGALSTFEQTGFYYNSDKVINIPISILSGIGTVLMPRVSALLAAENDSDAKKLFNNSLEGTVFIACALAFGIAAVSKEFVPIFFGEGYEPCVRLIYLFTPILVIKGMSFTARYQFLIPWKKDRIYIISVFTGAAVNLIINALLIPDYGAVGAVIGTLASELIACAVQFVLIKKYVDYLPSLLQSLPFFVIGAVMLIAVRLSASFLPGGIGALLAEIFLGAFVYLLLSFLYLKITGKISVILGLLKKEKQKPE